MGCAATCTATDIQLTFDPAARGLDRPPRYDLKLLSLQSRAQLLASAILKGWEHRKTQLWNINHIILRSARIHAVVFTSRASLNVDNNILPEWEGEQNPPRSWAMPQEF